MNALSPLPPSMSCGEVQLWTGRYDAVGVDGRVANVVVVFDVKHIDGLCHTFGLVKFAGI